jgi:hypothetical protein
MPRRARDPRTTTLDHLRARVDAVVAQHSGCRRLVHLYLPGNSRPRTPDCAACAELQRQYETDAPSAPTKAVGAGRRAPRI